MDEPRKSKRKFDFFGRLYVAHRFAHLGNPGRNACCHLVRPYICGLAGSLALDDRASLGRD